MIKTVSFAPSRPSGSRSSAKTSGAKLTPVEALRPANSRPASGRTPKAPAQTSLELLFDAPEEVRPETLAPAPPSEVGKKAPKTEKPKSEKLKSEKPEPQDAVAASVEVAASPVEEKPVRAIKTSESGEVKAKRARVPKDFAAQYGEKVVVRAAAVPVEVETPKKRLTKVERQARRDLIKPSEGLLERLARVNQIAARKPKSEPRGKGWKFVCGRCGTTSYFETPGGLCACGTIAVKE